LTLIRPEVVAGLRRGREAITAGAVIGIGLWLAWLGGLVLVPLGLGVAGVGAAWALQALRRLRFAQGVEAPGVVEVDEGQVGYFGPGIGGFVGLPDLVELRLVAIRGRRMWRLKQADGQALLVPVDAAGAERLFDAFASLPGMDTQALVSALEPRGTVGVSDSLVIWRRAARVALT
jgi:hypothetical protein